MLLLDFSTSNTNLTKSKQPSLNIEIRIKAEAKRLGFALCGITLPETGKAFDRYQTWVDEGLHAEMSYLARPDSMAKRQNPGLLLPECKSVICLALPYPPTQIETNEDDRQALRGSIAGYAHFIDYHTVMREKLEALAHFIEGLFAQQVHWYAAVDSSPVLEKSFAIQAGLGQLGKNTLLWNEDLGTWFNLGELFLDIALEPDSPQNGDFCGDCDICIRACPSGALRGNRTMDARRCLSYLTIEYRGSLPLEFRNALGKQVFGCDICQLVCPKNLVRLPENVDCSLETILEPEIDLLEALSLSPEAFKKRFAGTAVMRAKHLGFRRNVIIALGNSGRPEALKALQSAIKTEEDPVCLESMHWAILRLAAALNKKP